ncbi:hypothetical protein [Paenibacillus thiaminolyticus]|uniref:Uncharacterized protein n=1 Tax=Paenibacillus thiaminolyticus TaxID=49283 RepID=A0A3A3GBF1_PANTH|nr:hypothetical protein [Paenibacillus thiaminolyticus]RJG17758.1 hypothetical protein DQX05_27395 [Paenibacillus thiaminolyticus]
MSKAKRQRRKIERSGGINPDIVRNTWTRKPHTQIVPNKKAEQRRMACRKGRGAVPYFPAASCSTRFRFRSIHSCLRNA